MNTQRMLLRAAALSFAALVSTVPAQNYVATGDIASAATIELAVMNRGGTNSSTYSLPNNVGTILWDPSQPDSFILGNTSGATRGGTLIRSSFVGPGQISS